MQVNRENNLRGMHNLKEYSQGECDDNNHCLQDTRVNRESSLTNAKKNATTEKNRCSGK